ncbi:EF-hand protein [Venustampulla echinocandica]|uniref:EF-hand protein n=1 Tax=Venustampulla echinocandica TaxID=2656787 RepID=A0A370TSF0_9HELO|nr:EF-hand protein [Venustampulla echinocandica]RDL38456.1 EF-hand protein [Venustampulla echinocandica]
MAEDPTAPSLNLAPEEKRVFGQLFRQADTEGLGVVTGEVAVKFFEKTRLEPRILGEIWQIADKENRGLLTPAGFGIVLRLIGHYQAGRDPTPELALRPGPLPKFDGGSAPGMSPTIQPPPGPPPGALQPQTSGSPPIRVPPLTPDKAAQYAALFEKSGAQNGQLPGEQAKQIFERAGLSNEVLVRIWTLADTEQRGALQVTEFVIAMHLLASFKAGTLRALPTVLPAGLYEAAARRPPSRQATGTSSIPAVPAIPRQFSGATGAPRAGSPLSRSAYAAPQQYAQYSGPVGEWAITPSDKAKFDAIYSTLDTTNKGYITGEEAVPFFSESKLPEEALAQIWDLADINSAGRLSRDEFAVGMYLIRQQRGKRDGRESLPATLPPNLIPPSMRNQVKPAAVPTAPHFDAAPSLPKSAAEDLFGLDALSSPVPAPSQAPLSTGGSASPGLNDPFGNKTPITPSSPTHSPPQQSSIFKSFNPSSSFGQSLSYQATGGSNSSGPSQSRSMPPQNTVTEDLLGDNDPEISKRLTDETTEFANLSNQVGNLTKKMQDVQGQRATSQVELNQASTQKYEFEQRLAQLRTLYEQEAQSVRSLEEKLTASRNGTKKLQTEIAMVEGTYQDLQTQHRQVATALQADQQENASLKERMRAVNAEIVQLKPALEKLRSDARQQKGLVAINKKQLATNESEREKLKIEAEELNKSIEEDTRTLASASKAHSPAQSSSSQQVASPTPSTISANNPFFRRQGSSSEIATSAYTSPTQQGDRSFENVFGPAFGEAATIKEGPPPTTFRQEKEIQSTSSGSAASSHTQAGNGTDLSPTLAASPATSNRELPQSNIPPPPPESRQISSSFLPFPEHEDSVTSSRQVSAPNSRFGESSTGADTPTNYIGTTPTGSSSAGPAENPAPASPGLGRNSTASPTASATKDSIPGAFPGETNSNIIATPTGGSTLSEQAAADPFEANKELVRSGTSKDDFDAAFAGFGAPAKLQERTNTGSSAGGSASGAPAGFHKEFPPIAELENDDDSDSGSDRGGFDDDFAPASPSHARKSSSAQSPTLTKSTLGEAPSDSLQARPGTSHTSSARTIGTAPPTPGAQISPPAYANAVSPSEQAHSDVQQYSGLLPSRDVPAPAATTSTEPSTSTAAGQVPFGFPPTSSQPAPPAKVPFDDDFDDFDGLEDAKEGDVDDDFANISVNDRSGLDDFNPMFDSPPQSKGAEHSNSGNSFGGDSVFAEFTQSPKSTHPSTTATNTADSHDWDAIFAGLDTAAPAETGSTNAVDSTTQQNGNGAAPSPTAERPQPGRALTETGVHDDPILKNLTGMGYPRTDALAALEKYDYNLERAANYLASQS